MQPRKSCSGMSRNDMAGLNFFEHDFFSMIIGQEVNNNAMISQSLL
jgi:hypothetical protein